MRFIQRSPVEDVPMSISFRCLALLMANHFKRRSLRGKTIIVQTKVRRMPWQCAALRATVIIPAFHTQIDMFEENLNAGQVLINDRTVFFVYTGANDLAAAFFQFENGVIDLPQFLELLTVIIPGDIAAGVERLMSLGAKHIAVLGQFNLGIAPRLLADVEGIEARHEVAAEIDGLVTLFNSSLKERLENFNNKRLAFVDIQTPIRKVANTLTIGGQEGYFFSIGEQCVRRNRGDRSTGEGSVLL